MTIDFGEWLEEVGIESMKIDEYFGGEKVFDLLVPYVNKLEKENKELKTKIKEEHYEADRIA